jgi:hypothetical protein
VTSRPAKQRAADTLIRTACGRLPAEVREEPRCRPAAPVGPGRQPCDDGRYRAAGQSHAGLILVSTKTFPRNRGFSSGITASLTTLLSDTTKIQSGQVLFLARG